MTEVHYRFAKRRACGSSGGPSIVAPVGSLVSESELRRVSCGDCVRITNSANLLALDCGCRRPAVHLSVAQAIDEMRHC